MSIFRAGYLSIYELSYMWYSVFAVVVVNVVGAVVSLLTCTFTVVFPRSEGMVEEPVGHYLFVAGLY